LISVLFMGKSFVLFLIVFIAVLSSTYFIHNVTISYFNLQADIKFVKLSYAYNVAFNIILVSLIVLLQHKFKNELGFIFIAGSFIKVALFIFYTRFISLEISKGDFVDFFVPYATGMILEVYYLARILNNIK